jgi:hypothetical protein
MKEIQQWTEVTSRGGRERPKFGKRLVFTPFWPSPRDEAGCGVLIGAESTQHTCAFFTFGH